ncbi:MAG: lysophospholipid acyltransferase family protein [Candidatus Omnitrophica bacterium]|nr:lysophospholipid acyltransferase family protein [Candidatus Omnitrophota bacterium]
MKGRYFHYAAANVLSRVLPKRFVWGLMRAAARVYSHFTRDLAAIVSNLEAVSPDRSDGKGLRRRARRVVVEFAGYLVDLFYSYQLSLSFIERHVEVRGREHLDKALSARKGTIVASAHVGNWEMAGMTLAKLGYPLHGIALRHRDPRIDRIFGARREAHGLRVIPLGGSSLRAYRALQAGEVLALNGDRLFGKKGARVRFLGREVTFPRGLARLSLATGAPVLPVFFVSLGFNRFLLEIQEPLKTAGEEAMLRSFASRAEAVIRSYPSQWFIFQPFWEAPAWPD